MFIILLASLKARFKITVFYFHGIIEILNHLHKVDHYKSRYEVEIVNQFNQHLADHLTVYFDAVRSQRLLC